MVLDKNSEEDQGIMLVRTFLEPMGRTAMQVLVVLLPIGQYGVILGHWKSWHRKRSMNMRATFGIEENAVWHILREAFYS